jgi:hypothetical protein
MKIDRTHRAWAAASTGIFASATIIYVIYSTAAPQGARGGSLVGLIFGVLGFSFMIFAALLGARKRVPTWRLGRAQSWMRGHLWLGLLSLPLILFHGGFHFGGTLSAVLMCLLIVTVLSGLFGAGLQHFVPARMTSDIPLETIYDEIGHVRSLLCEEADRAMESICGAMNIGKALSSEQQRAGGFSAQRGIAASAAPLRTSAAVSAGASAAVAPAPEIYLLTKEESAPLRKFYFDEVWPYLKTESRRTRLLSDAKRTSAAFAGLRTFLPASAHPALEDLEEICDEARQLAQQEQLHRLLHGWLLVHIPISLALILLGAVHALMALRY